MWVNCRASGDRVFGSSAWGGGYLAKITCLIWQVLHLNFSQPNFLRALDPFGQRVQGTACKQSLADSEFRELK
jgi:hypothetical protein